MEKYQVVYATNQLTGIYQIATLVLNELKGLYKIFYNTTRTNLKSSLLTSYGKYGDVVFISKHLIQRRDWLLARVCQCVCVCVHARI